VQSHHMRRALCAIVLIAGAFLAAVAPASPAFAQDLSTALSEAESRAEAAVTEVGELETAVGPVESRFDVSAERAAPVKAAARAAEHRVARIEGRLRARRLAAATKVSRIEEERRDAADEHDETVRFGLGFALAALVAAGIAFGWDWFRASPVVAWLTGVSLGQAIGLCVGGGLLMVIVGAAMGSADGVVGVIGAALFVLGFVLANALVLARHSVEVQRGHSKPILRRERLPRRVAQVTAGVLAALCLIGLGTAVFAGEDESSEASAALRREAENRSPSTPALADAKAQAARLDQKAALRIAAARADQRDLRTARRKLDRAEARLASAESDAASFTHRLAVLSAHEEREAEAEARRAEEAAELAVEEEEAASGCDPNYTGCVPNTGYDVDCSEVSGSVEVIGTDVDGLDADADGIGCE
jgi:hypothetical protein